MNQLLLSPSQRLGDFRCFCSYTSGIDLLLLKSLLGLLSTLLGLLNLLLAEEEKSLDLLGQSVLLGFALRNALATNEGGDNAGSDNKGEDEAVHAVPVRSKSAAGSTGIVVVQEGEGEELGDEGVLDGEQQGGPSDSRGDAASGISAEAMSTTIPSPLKTPVDGAKEGQDLLLDVRAFHRT